MLHFNHLLFCEALAVLSRKMMSQYMLSLHLKKKFPNDATEEDMQALFQHLIALGFLNDRLYAEAIARRFQHQGNHAINQRLLTKGITASLITDAIATLPPETTRAKIALQKKIKNRTFKNRESMQSYTWRFLSTRGFSTNTFYEISKTELLFTDESTEY